MMDRALALGLKIVIDHYEDSSDVVGRAR